MSRAFLCIVGVLAVAATGCIRSTNTLVVNDDGSGTGEIVVAIDPEAVSEVAGQAGGGVGAEQLAGADADQICTQFAEGAVPAALPPEATISDYDEDGFCGRRIQFSFADEAGLVVALEALGGDQADSADEIVLRQEGGDWIFEAPLTGVTDAIESGAGPVPRALLSTVLSQADVRYVVTLPGDAVEGQHNADTVDGGTFTWNVDLTDPPQQLLARTSEGSGRSVVGVALLAVLGASLVGAAGLFVFSRSRGATPTGAMAERGSGSTSASTQAGPPVQPFRADPAPPSGRPAAAPTPQEPVVAEPRWDEGRGAWVADHPVEGLLIHDDESATWRRAD